MQPFIYELINNWFPISFSFDLEFPSVLSSFLPAQLKLGSPLAVDQQTYVGGNFSKIKSFLHKLYTTLLLKLPRFPFVSLFQGYLQSKTGTIEQSNDK